MLLQVMSMQKQLDKQHMVESILDQSRLQVVTREQLASSRLMSTGKM